MSSTTLFRLSGLALLIALPLLILGFVLHPPSEQVVDVLKPLYGPAHLIELVSWIFVLLGLPGFYARQAGRAGKLGLVGFVLSMLAAAYHLYLLLYEAYATPFLAQNAATQALIGPDGPLAHGAAGAMGMFGIATFALVLAWPLFGIATVRAAVFPRWSGWLQIVCVPVFFLGMLFMSPDEPAPFGTLGLSPLAAMYYLLFLGYAWGGYALWREKEPVNHKSVPQTGEAHPVT